MNRLLRRAYEAHKAVKGHETHTLHVGLNFIECLTCYKHAHIQRYPSCKDKIELIMHDATGIVHERIKPEEF